MLIPSIAVAVRRMHDIDKSGGWLFIVLIPIVGPIWLLVLTCLDSTPGDNQYGANPKQPAASIQYKESSDSKETVITK